MIRLDDRTVEFDRNGEVETSEQFDTLLDLGKRIPDAAQVALNRMIKDFEDPTPEFVAYLSEDTCVLHGGEVVVKQRWAS